MNSPFFCFIRVGLFLGTFTASSVVGFSADEVVAGNLTIEGDVDIEGDALSVGTRSDSGVIPGLMLWYGDAVAPSVYFSATRNNSSWLWQRDSSKTQMKLSGDNKLQLFDQATTPVAKITLDPLGVSTFSNSIMVGGIDNTLPNQTLTGSESILTQGLADGRYLQNTGGGILSLGLGNGLAAGEGALAMGDSSVASGDYSVALGSGISTGDYSIAMGLHSEAKAVHSVSIGSWSEAAAEGATAINGHATGFYSIAIGSNAHGESATALGGSSAQGKFSMAFGGSSVDGDYATAGGGGVAWGTHSTAIGGYAWGAGSIAIGSGDAAGAASVMLGGGLAGGLRSMALGGEATGDYSVALGYSYAQGYAQVAIGQNNLFQGDPINWVATDDLFIIGNGYGEFSNALTVHKNGNARIGGTLQVRGGIRVPPGGDISMGDFQVGNDPATLSDGLRYETE